MSRLILPNKPFRVISQFSASDGKQTLADFIDMSAVYPAGHLDVDMAARPADSYALAGNQYPRGSQSAGTA